MAHASVASLTRTIESLLTFNSPMQSLTYDHREEISDLHEKTSTLEVVVKNFEKNNVCGEMTDFEVEVEEVASAAEHTIQLRVTEVVLANDEKTHERLSDTLQLVAEDIDRIWKVSTKIQDKGKQVSEGSLVQDFSSSTNNILNVNNNMVGRDDQKERLLENLTGNYSGEPKVIPIVGMGGIGKTTLVKEVYNHESILHRFDVRAWATVSQQHNIKEILLSLLQSTIKMDDVIKTKGEAELADMLQKSLKRKRYLIVLDDIWSCEVWDGMRRCFPTEDSAGSRILLTTRNNEVARDAGIENLSMQMIGKVLPKMSQDSEIPAKNLMRSWMAEEFLKLGNDLEGEAEKCLQELVDRCLVLVCKKSLDGTKMRSCKVHDLIYDLCVREIQRESIFIMNDTVLDYSYSECRYLSMQKMQPFKRVTGDEIDYCPYGLYRALRTPVHRQLRDHDNNDLLKRTHSIFSFHLKDSYFSGLQSELIHFKLLKVLELRDILIDNFPVQILSLIWLRYLSLQCHVNLDIPPEICKLWNLQTFIVQVPPNVKELGINGYEINFNSIRDSELLNNLVHLQQLETLSFIGCFPLFPASASAFPATLKKLMLRFTLLSWSDLDIIAELPNLEVLKVMDYACRGEEWHPNVRRFARLKLLLIEYNDLKYLKEIPIEFAEIHTLQLIELTRCLPELGESATRIQKEQEDLGNNPVDVRISNPYDEFDDDDDDDDDYDDDDDDDEENSYVDVAEDNDNEDSDADAAKRDDN
ncbi:hypothetical protein BC332_17879 [Capsicum chinense]|nr:hypothetical protein BC332_17879 [Capsicum chinense]